VRPLFFLLLLLTTGCTGRLVQSSTSHFPPNTGFLPRSLTLDHKPHNFSLFIPKSYSPDTPYPAILFLHGLFESGRDGVNCLSAGLGPIIARDPDTFPFIVVFPQTRGTWLGEKKERLALACLDAAQREFNIDPDRVILAGLSFGGRGVYEIAARNPHRFAALVPVSGPANTELIAHLTATPVWAFHYKGDPFVPVRSSQQMVQRINARGGHARYTEFPSIGHDAWPRAVTQSDLLPWLLSQRRPAAQVALPLD
jgi:predicted peptidase